MNMIVEIQVTELLT